MGQKAAGLRKRNGIYHINGIHVEGCGSIYRSTGTGDEAEAIRIRDEVIREIKAQAAVEAEQRRLASQYGVRPPVVFRDLATVYLEDQAECGKRSLPDEARWIAWMDPFIGQTPIAEIYDESLRPMVEASRAAGNKSRTVRAKLEVLRHMLHLAARKYRHPVTKLTLLAEAPLITLPAMTDKRPPYPLTWAEQRLLFQELPDHLANMALYTVNTGCRDEEVTGLQWQWEQRAVIRGKERSIFVLPRTKNGLPRAVVLNDVAQSVVDGQRGVHKTYVFTYLPAGEGAERQRVNAVNQSAWRKARARAAEKYPAALRTAPPAGFQDLHFHDLRHTVGRRLRAAGVSNETRADILGHRNGNMTTDYSQAELTELFDAVQLIAAEGEQAPTMLRVVNG